LMDGGSFIKKKLIEGAELGGKIIKKILSEEVDVLGKSDLDRLGEAARKMAEERGQSLDEFMKESTPEDFNWRIKTNAQDIRKNMPKELRKRLQNEMERISYEDYGISPEAVENLGGLSKTEAALAALGEHLDSVIDKADTLSDQSLDFLFTGGADNAERLADFQKEQLRNLRKQYIEQGSLNERQKLQLEMLRQLAQKSEEVDTGADEEDGDDKLSQYEKLLQQKEREVRIQKALNKGNKVDAEMIRIKARLQKKLTPEKEKELRIQLKKLQALKEQDKVEQKQAERKTAEKDFEPGTRLRRIGGTIKGRGMNDREQQKLDRDRNTILADIRTNTRNIEADWGFR